MDAGAAVRLALTIAGGGIVAAVLVARAPARAPQQVPVGLGAVLEALPGGNCGACGRASCFATAEAMLSGRAPATACTAGGATTALAVAAAMRRLRAAPPEL